MTKRMLTKRQCVFVIVVLPLLIIPAFVILRMSDKSYGDGLLLIPLPKGAQIDMNKHAGVHESMLAKLNHHGNAVIKAKPKRCFDFIWTGQCRDTCFLYNIKAKRRQRKQTVLRCTNRKTQLRINYTPKMKYVFKAPFKDKCLERVLNWYCRKDGRTVPNIVHYVWLGKNEFQFTHFLSFLSAHKIQNPCLILVHADKMPKGLLWNYFLQISPKVIHVHRRQPKKIFKTKLASVEHRADIVKLEALKEYGGIYLDTDQVLTKSVDKYRDFGATLGTEYGQTATNAIIMARKDSKFIKMWYDSYHTYIKKDGNKHSNEIPYRMAMKYKSLVHVIGRTFSFPNAHQLPLLYSRNMDWDEHYGIHMHLKLHKRFYPRDRFTIETVRYMNNTAGAVARHILYDNKNLCT